MNRLPLVTVVVPAKNEAADIAGCVAHIAAQDYPVNRLEVMVIDGASTDATATIASEALRRCGFAASDVLTNAKGTTPSNLNLGLSRAHGEVLVRVDARSRIERHHVRTCVEVLQARPDVAVVGGSQLAIPRDPGSVSVGIARALNNRWSMGLSRYRRRTSSGPADTVYLGAFRTDQLRDAKGWDDRLLTNQDFELNRRIGRRGLVWFDSRLCVAYIPRRSLGALLRQYHRFGRWKSVYWRITGDRPLPRQYGLVAAPVVVATTLAIAMCQRATRLPTIACLALGLAVFESRGSTSPHAPGPGAHLVAAAASGVVAAGWWSGVVGGVAVQFLQRRPKG